MDRNEQANWFLDRLNACTSHIHNEQGREPTGHEPRGSTLTNMGILVPMRLLLDVVEFLRNTPKEDGSPCP